MSKSFIDALLDKYWAAETSLEEEATLMAYFKSDGIDPAHASYRSLFNYYDLSAQAEPKNQLELTPTLVNDYNKTESFVVKFRPLLKYAAALLVLVIGYGVFVNQYPLPDAETQYAGKYTTLDTEEDAEEALAITLEALGFLTAKINKTENTIIGNFEPIQKAIRVIQ